MKTGKCNIGVSLAAVAMSGFVCGCVYDAGLPVGYVVVQGF